MSDLVGVDAEVDWTTVVKDRARKIRDSIVIITGLGSESSETPDANAYRL